MNICRLEFWFVNEIMKSSPKGHDFQNIFSGIIAQFNKFHSILTNSSTYVGTLEVKHDSDTVKVSVLPQSGFSQSICDTCTELFLNKGDLCEKPLFPRGSRCVVYTTRMQPRVVTILAVIFDASVGGHIYVAVVEPYFCALVPRFIFVQQKSLTMILQTGENYFCSTVPLSLDPNPTPVQLTQTSAITFSPVNNPQEMHPVFCRNDKLFPVSNILLFHNDMFSGLIVIIFIR